LCFARCACGSGFYEEKKTMEKKTCIQCKNDVICRIYKEQEEFLRITGILLRPDARERLLEIRTICAENCDWYDQVK